MAKRGPKSHAYRDLWIYLYVSELRHAKGAKKVAKLRAIHDAVPKLAKECGIHLSIPGLWSSFAKGEKAYHDKNHKWELPKITERLPKNMGRPMDAVRGYIIYDAVCDALTAMRKPSLRKAYSVARQYLRTEWPNDRILGARDGASIGAIRAAYEKMKVNLEKAAARAAVKAR